MDHDKPASRFVTDFPHKLNTEVLAQFCGARTEPFTGHVSYVLCKDFKISVKGQRNMNNILNNLPVFRTPDERLAFGWAEHNLIRSRLVHEGAYEHLAIMITLGEAFHESYAARVMFEMAQMGAGYEDITPHFRQWKNVIHSINGAFSTTDFGIVVEDYIRLDPYNVTTGLHASMAEIPIHAKTLAEALLALGKLTMGHETQLTITGSLIIAWLAAISDWLYDLRIAIFSSGGTPLHSTSPDQDPQIVFVFTEKPGCQVSNKPWSQPNTSQASHENSAQAPSSPPSYPTSIHQSPFTGRVVWQSLLPRVFGQAFHRLDHEDSRPFATMLGSAARLFQALAHDEFAHNPTTTTLVSASNKTNTSSYGPGLIETLTNWLPELRRFQGRMERQLKLSAQDAAAAYRDSLSTLRGLCDCGICRPLPPASSTPTPTIITTETETETETPLQPPTPAALPSLSKLSLHPLPHPAPQNGYCLPTLVETIIALTLTLSRLILSPSLYPSRAGIQALYHSQLQRRLAARGLPWTQHFQLVYGNEWNAPDNERLVNALQIFAGSRPSRYLGERGLVGVAHEGVCAYLVGLERWGFGKGQSLGSREGNGLGQGGGEEGKVKGKGGKEEEGVKLIRIVSGGINVRYKVFQRVVLGEVASEDWDDPWERVSVDHVNEVLCCR